MGNIQAPVALCAALLVIGLLNYIVFSVMDKKFDKQLAAAGVANNEQNEEEFKFSDVKAILTSKSFWIVAILCVLYYSAIFPFQKYGANMLQCNLGISATAASNIFRWFPIGAAIITPFLGRFLDKKGKGATMLLFGSLLLIICHLVFAFVVPSTQSAFIAYTTIVILGISFALVPAALWPSVPKIIEEKLLGSAYSLIFWVQNIGLFFVPLLIGAVLETSNADNIKVQEAKAQIENITVQADEAKEAGDTEKVEQLREEADSVLIPYDYTTPLVIFAGFGISALLVAIYLKRYDKKKNLGLEETNIKE
jgi:predicted MFS family arabinose efflux permease